MTDEAGERSWDKVLKGILKEFGVQPLTMGTCSETSSMGVPCSSLHFY